jgi:hypothetical protein
MRERERKKFVPARWIRNLYGAQIEGNRNSHPIHMLIRRKYNPSSRFMGIDFNDITQMLPVS